MRSPESFVASDNDGQFHDRQVQSDGTFPNDNPAALLDIPAMEFNRDSLLALIDEGLRQRGWSDNKLAREAGLKPHNIADLRRGKTQVLRGDRLQKLLAALDKADTIHLSRNHAGLDDEFVLIPVYDVRASMGAGSTADRAEVLYNISFRKDWLHRITSTSAKQLAAISTIGDSMEPTLSDGDTVLVDRGQVDSIREDGIYVIDFDGLLLVKRLRFDPVRRLVRVISDNSAYDPVDDVRPEELRIFGRAIWLARKL